MFKKTVPLNKDKHKNLKLIQVSSFAFAQNVNKVPVGLKEMVRVSRYYPIVIPGKGVPVPVALFSLKPGENHFVDENGQWTAPYIPAYLRLYPFVLGRTEGDGSYTVCIDPDAPHFSQESGDPLYTEEGEPTELLNNAIERLKSFFQEMTDTERLFSVLQEKGVLLDKQFDVEVNGQASSFGGFKAVDYEKLREVENKTLGDWVKRGVMSFVYAHLHSLENAQKLAL